MADVEDTTNWPALPFEPNPGGGFVAEGAPAAAAQKGFGNGQQPPPAAAREETSSAAASRQAPSSFPNTAQADMPPAPPPPPPAPASVLQDANSDKPPMPNIPLTLDTARSSAGAGTEAGATWTSARSQTVDVRVKGPQSNSTPTSNVPASTSSKGMKRSQSISHSDWLTKNPKRKSTLRNIEHIEDKGGKSSPVKFVPAKWEGPKKGYIHRTSVLGTGYYRETDDIKQTRSMVAGGNSSIPVGLHPALQGSGLTISNLRAATRGRQSNLSNLGAVHEEVENWSDSSATEASTGLGLKSRAEMRVREHVKFADEYQMTIGKGIWNSADADWLTARLAEQYRQERIGHNFSLAANVHSNPTHRGENMVWNELDKKSRENLSYYERLHETAISGIATNEGSVAGGWEQVLKSKNLSAFLPDPKDIDSRPVSEMKYTWEEQSSVESTMFSDGNTIPRDLGHETDWLATPTAGVTGKKEFKKKANLEADYQKKYYGSENAIKLHRALQRDSRRQVGHRFYITHDHPGVGHAKSARTAVWNQKAVPMKRTGANNPKPERLKEGIRAARAKIQNYIHNQRRLAEEAEVRAREMHMGREPTVRSMSQSTDTESSNRMRERRSSVARDSFDHREDIPVTSQYDGVDAYM